MSLRRTVFEAVGGFRAEFGRVGTLPVGCEETELCIRAHRAFPDQVLLFEPNARVAHYVPAERSTFKYFAARCYAEGMSKAQVTRLMGARDGLASERAYTLRTLPAGVLRNLAHAVRHLDGNSVLRAGAIVAGLGITTVGYLRGKLVPGASSERARAVEFDTISASEG
jgi:hypothetical protein